MISTAPVLEVLGLHDRSNAPHTPLALVARIENGLPVSAVERVSKLLAPGDSHFKYRIVPKATYERRKNRRHLSPDEGMLLARMARVWSMAVDVWGQDDEARDFLFRAHPMLEDRRPIDLVIESEIGSELVRDILAGLKYGSAA